MLIRHPIAPVWDERSRVLILGSFPSVKSREGQFFYHHPQNRFWPVLSAVLHAPLPQSIEEKTALLLTSGIALWDVAAACEIDGSDDASIRSVQPNDLTLILSGAPIERIYCNGGTALRLYRKLLEPELQRPAVGLPSTSPANARWTLAKLTEAWQVIVP